jgi:putative RNA 2'-phosphotransferase
MAVNVVGANAKVNDKDNINDKDKYLVTISKFMAKVLRHEPELIGIKLDQNGWVSVDVLIREMSRHLNQTISFALIAEIVKNDSKGRYEFSENSWEIRATQGHSKSGVNLEYEIGIPPDTLYHGTIMSFVKPIMETGLNKMSRHHVHLTPEIATAHSVGSRRGKPVILLIDAKKMSSDGIVFFKSKNGYWLVDHVPAKYIQIGAITVNGN